MASPTELPDLVGEFIDLSKQYLREQTVEPARRLGRLAGFSAAASVLFVLAAGFLAVAGSRWLLRIMPDGAVWSGVGYLLATVGLLAATGLVMWRASR
ncbi:MAG: phage holin family protein [Acidimicrobiia bacterium]|nr:phage holin family protein [Acidimicrobiia bacterium]